MNGPSLTSGPAALDRLRDFLGLERNVLVMMSAGIVQGFGVALWAGYLPKVLEALGAAGLMIGVFGTVAALLGVVFPYLGGLLSDRLGRGRAMILASALSGAGYLIYMLAPKWWVFLPGLVLCTAGATFGFMGSLALTGEALPARRRAVSIAARGLLGGLPALVGPPIGGALILWLGLVRGVRVSLLLTVVLTLAAILLQRRHYRMPSPQPPVQRRGFRSAWRAMRPELKRLLAADCMLRFGSGMTAIFVVLYVMNVLGGSALQFGFLKSLEILTPALLVIPAAKLADRAGRHSRRPLVAASYFFFAAFPLALALAPSSGWLIAVFVIAGLRHVGEPARKALIIDLADGPDRGHMIGVYHSVRGFVVFPASLVGGLLWERLPVAPFVVGPLLSGLGLLWFLFGSPGRTKKE